MNAKYYQSDLIRLILKLSHQSTCLILLSQLFLLQQQKMDQTDFYCHEGNMFQGDSSMNPNDHDAFLWFDNCDQCENQPYRQLQQYAVDPSISNEMDAEDYGKYFHHQFSKTEAEEPAQQIFIREEQVEQIKKGSTDCQNSPKLMAKVICQLFKKTASSQRFSDEAKQYAKFAIDKLKKSPTIDSLAQIFVQIPKELRDQRKKPVNAQKFNFSLSSVDLQNYQKELRAFFSQRKQECLRMAAKRQIKDTERLSCFIKYVEAFIQNLGEGVVKRKLKKF